MLTNREQDDAIIEPAFPAIAFLRVAFRSFSFLFFLLFSSRVSCDSREATSNRESLSRFVVLLLGRGCEIFLQESPDPKTLGMFLYFEGNEYFLPDSIPFIKRIQSRSFAGGILLVRSLFISKKPHAFPFNLILFI